MAHYSETFDSVAAFLDAAETPTGIPQTDAYARRGRTLTANTALLKSWYDLPESVAATWPAVREHLAKGDEKRVARLREEMEQITLPPVRNVRRRGVWADQGDELNRDRLYAGYSDPWRTARRQASTGTAYVRLVAEIGGRAFMRGPSMFYSGAAVAVLAEALQAAGYEVEIVGANVANKVTKSRQADTLTLAIVVKPFQAPLALPPILAACASAAFHRTAVFAVRPIVIHRAGRVPSGCGGGGLSVSLTLAMLPGTLPNVRTILIPRCMTRAEANAAVRQAVSTLEAPLC